MTNLSKLALAYQRINLENADDPNKEILQDIAVAKELLYRQRMTSALMLYYPEASEAL